MNSKKKIIRYNCILALIITISSCQPVEEREGYIGYVEADLLYIAAPQNGWIETMAVDTGDPVSVDMALFELDIDFEDAALAQAKYQVSAAESEARNLDTGAREPELEALQASLRGAEAALRYAEIERKRWAGLANEDVASKSNSQQADAAAEEAEALVEQLKKEIEAAALPGREALRDAASARVDAAVAGVEQSQWRYDQRSVISKRAGEIQEVFFRQGEFVTVGAPILALLPADSLKVRFFVPQDEVANFKLGDTIYISHDGRDTPEAAEVSFIAREAEFTPPVVYSVGARDKLVFLVEARLPAGTEMHPGQPVDIRMAPEVTQ